MQEFFTYIRRESSGLVLIVILAIIAVFGGIAFGQSQSDRECEQDKQVKSTGKIKTQVPVDQSFVFTKSSDSWAPGEYVVRGRFVSPGNSEKAIAVESNVYVSMCVTQGMVKINGWDRNEVRAFVKGGKELGFKVIERTAKEKIPNWIEVIGHDSSESRSGKGDKCLSGEMIEMDVPMGASVTIKGISSPATIDSVKRASIEIVGGDILLNNISDKIEARTQQGGVTVNNSSGKMEVSTTTGNIVAFNTEALETGDYFKATTRSGAVTMQSIGQKEVNASSISGSINYLGEIKNYGQYGFTTTNGLVNMIIPSESCFWLSAAFGGRFVSDFPVTVFTEDETDSAVYLKGRVGKCEANLTLNSFSGTIRIRKKEGRTDDPVEVRVP